MKTKTLVIVALLAFAAGGTCPSDVNNDGTVGINDFLQVLSDWGPCPTATVVASDAATPQNCYRWIVRVWSNNNVQYAMNDPCGDDCWECVNSTPLGQWLDIDPPQLPPGASPAGIAVQTRGTSAHLYVMYTDGTTYFRQFSSGVIPEPKCNPPIGNACIFQAVTDWELFAQ